jgi:hypothetical protein
MDWRKMVCGPALTMSCSISNTTMGFTVESDGTEDKDSSTENMRHTERGGVTQRHYMEMSGNFKP